MEAYEAHNRCDYVGALFERYAAILLEPARRTVLNPTRETTAL